MQWSSSNLHSPMLKAPHTHTHIRTNDCFGMYVLSSLMLAAEWPLWAWKAIQRKEEFIFIMLYRRLLPFVSLVALRLYYFALKLTNDRKSLSTTDGPGHTNAADLLVPAANMWECAGVSGVVRRFVNGCSGCFKNYNFIDSCWKWEAKCNQSNW